MNSHARERPRGASWFSRIHRLRNDTDELHEPRLLLLQARMRLVDTPGLLKPSLACLPSTKIARLTFCGAIEGKMVGTGFGGKRDLCGTPNRIEISAHITVPFLG